MDRVAALVGAGHWGQDWGIENAEPERVEVFCDAYDRLELSSDERFALMILIVASWDERARDDAEPALVRRIRALLQRDFAIHFHTVRYWACLDHPEEDDGYRITPEMRSLYRSCTPKLVLAAIADDISALEAAL